jgi:hypothetical protein
MCRPHEKVGENVANQGCGTGWPLGPILNQFVNLFFFMSTTCPVHLISCPMIWLPSYLEKNTKLWNYFDVIFSLFCYILSLRSICTSIPLHLGIPVPESRLRKVVFKLLSVLFRAMQFFNICANIKQVLTIMSIIYSISTVHNRWSHKCL